MEHRVAADGAEALELEQHLDQSHLLLRHQDTLHQCTYMNTIHSYQTT